MTRLATLLFLLPLLHLSCGVVPVEPVLPTRGHHVEPDVSVTWRSLLGFGDRPGTSTYSAETQELALSRELTTGTERWVWDGTAEIYRDAVDPSSTALLLWVPGHDAFAYVVRRGEVLLDTGSVVVQQ